jgi:hypothetical protein
MTTDAPKEPEGGLAGDPPPPPSHQGRIRRTWTFVKWQSPSLPLTIGDYELQQIRVRTWLLRFLGALLFVTAVASLCMLTYTATLICSELTNAPSDTEARAFAFKLASVLGGASAFALIGSCLLLGRATHDHRKSSAENPWEGFPTVVTDLISEILKLLKARGG